MECLLGIVFYASLQPTALIRNRQSTRSQSLKMYLTNNPRGIWVKSSFLSFFFFNPQANVLRFRAIIVIIT